MSRRDRNTGSLLRSLFFAAMLLIPSWAEAEPWPVGLVRIVTPGPPGSALDFAARLLADRLATHWRQPVVIENRPGADGILAVQALLQASDGRTLLFAFPGVVTVVPLLHERLPFDPATDLAPIGSVADDLLVVAVNASLPVGSLDELVRHAAARPGDLNWTAAPGAPYLVFAEFQKRAGIRLTYVPYRSPTFAFPDLISDRIQVSITSLAGALALAREGKIKLLAVAARERSPAAPDIVTAAEAGHGELTIEAPLGLFGPKAMPPDLREKIAAVIRTFANEEAVVRQLGILGMIARPSTPTEYAAKLSQQRAGWAELARRHGVQPR